MAQLDRTEPHAEVFGVTENGHRFTQNGKMFDATGLEIGTEIDQKPKAKQKRRPAIEAVDEQDVDAQDVDAQDVDAQDVDVSSMI
jgi:hypothetical protein